MKRRFFLGLLGGTAAAGPAMVQEAVSPVLAQAGFAGAGAVAGAAPIEIEPPATGAIGKVIRILRRSGIPAWKMRELQRRANYERRFGIDPDIAALRSVSPGWKARKQRRRNLDRIIDTSLSSIGDNSERHNFITKLQRKFGPHVDWYE